MTKEPFNVYNGTQTTLSDVVENTKRVGDEQNASLPAAENTRGYVEAFFAVSRTDEGSPLPVGTYLDKLAPQIPADAKLLSGLVDAVEAKAGSGTLAVEINGESVSITTAGQTVLSEAQLAAMRSATASDIEFVVATDTITAGAVRVRIEYLR